MPAALGWQIWFRHLLTNGGRSEPSPGRFLLGLSQKLPGLSYEQLAPETSP